MATRRPSSGTGQVTAARPARHPAARPPLLPAAVEAAAAASSPSVPTAPVVAVTGAGSAAGAAIVAALAADPSVGGVVAVADVPPPAPEDADGTDAGTDAGTDREEHDGGRGTPSAPPGAPSGTGAPHSARWSTEDLTTPAVAAALAGADVVVHVATPTDLQAALGTDRDTRRWRAVASTEAVLTATAAVGARAVIAVTSAMVLGATADNPIPLPDDAPVAAAPDDGLVGDLLAVEAVLERATRASHLDVAVLRPAALVGPGVDTVITRHFEAPRLLTVRDSPSVWQFCHVDDLGTAVATAVRHSLVGPMTVGSEGVLTQTALEQLSGMRRVELAGALALATAERLQRIGVLPMPAGDLAYVVHPWVVGSSRLRAAGWAPRHDNEACLAALLEQVAARRAAAPSRRSGQLAVGAAGAAVAVVGTAALLRQARARSRRRS